jgi:hypothetical protein
MILYLRQGIWHPSMSLDRFKLPASPPGCVAAFPYLRYAAQQQQHGKGLADRHLCVLTVTGRIQDRPGSADLHWACLLHVPARIASGRPHALSAWLALIIARCVAAHMASRWPGSTDVLLVLGPGCGGAQGRCLGGKLIRWLGAWGVLVLL